MTSRIETVLTATLRDWRQSSFVWATDNCLMSVGKYARDLTGIDPCAEWAGSCQDEASALAVLDAHGGGNAILGGAMTGAGLSSVSEPRRGDVVCARIGGAEIGGLCLGAFCAFRMERGVMELRTGFLEIVGAWRCVD